MVALVTIIDENGTEHPLPYPSYYDMTTAAVVDSARNVSGYVRGMVIRDNIAKGALKWRYLTAAQWSEILKLFTAAYGGNFYNKVRFFDQVAGDFVTRDMYISDRTAGGWKVDANTGYVTGWTDCALSLVEV